LMMKHVVFTSDTCNLDQLVQYFLDIWINLELFDLFYMIYGEILFALLFNSRRQKNLMFVFLTFREPPDFKKGKIK
jgi:hypothetical protein